MKIKTILTKKLHLNRILDIQFISCLTLGLAFWIYPHVKMKNPSIIGLLVAVLLVILGELIGRGIFYGLHMTVGMAVVG
ncbi:DmsC/YnfH family molybdoenzyme membrane anchor subunit [Providencia huaxiensis]|uniref:DmsC/YnfH family molybdoenzyme membrane anchor subunit n=1 Tax=Providencia huaxiensis TaxID=2027290 RepID=UPI0030101E00